jgi:hypothetical protein
MAYMYFPLQWNSILNIVHSHYVNCEAIHAVGFESGYKKLLEILCLKFLFIFCSTLHFTRQKLQVKLIVSSSQKKHWSNIGKIHICCFAKWCSFDCQKFFPLTVGKQPAIVELKILLRLKCKKYGDN